MKKSTTFTVLTASLLIVSGLGSASVSASDLKEGLPVMDAWQEEISSDIASNGYNALKQMNINHLIDTRLELGSGFRTLQKRVAEDQVECEEKSLAAEPDTMPQEEAAVMLEHPEPGSPAGSVIRISSLVSGVIQ